MLKIIGLALVAFLFMGLVGGGTWAFFQDLELSQGNQITAGTLDLKTDDADGITETISASQMKRGDTASGNITLKNSGSKDAAFLDVDFAMVESDDVGNSVNVSANATAGQLEVTVLEYDGNDQLGSITDENFNGYIDVYDLVVSDLSGLAGVVSSATKVFTITVKLKESTTNDFQGDGVEISMTFTLNQ